MSDVTKELYEIDKFPIIIKLIANKERLSVQVHPEDDYARKVENTYGKTECWYMLETEKDASEVIAKCRENGVIAIKAKHKVRLLPALNIPTDVLLRAIDIIKTVCKE